MKKILLVLCVLAASITNGRAYWGLQPECPSTYHLTLIANPMDCSAYYVCESGIPVPMGCTEGLYFCAEKSICTWVWEPGCSFDCQMADSNDSNGGGYSCTLTDKCPDGATISCTGHLKCKFETIFGKKAVVCDYISTTCR